jgi:hypothetical protein
MWTDSARTMGACFAGCDVVAQNCGAGNKCTFGRIADGGVGRGCGTAGAVGEGQTCGAAQMDDCAAGLTCLQGTPSKCRKFCYRDSDCGAGKCALVGAFPGSPEYVSFCVGGCDPLTPTCATGEGCYPTQGGSVCSTAGAVATGGTCSATAGNCVPGDLCVLGAAGATSGTCKKICNTDGGMPSCGTAACQALAGANFGACP